MSRVTFPDEGSRLAFFDTFPEKALLSAAEQVFDVYSDADATDQATGLTEMDDTTAITTLEVTDGSLIPQFRAPEGTKVLYVRPHGSTGPTTAIYASGPGRLDVLESVYDPYATPDTHPLSATFDGYPRDSTSTGALSLQGDHVVVGAGPAAGAIAPFAFTPPLPALGLPLAQEQSTVRGRTIHRMVPFNGRVLCGYGDYNANTGPITLYSIDPTNLSTPAVALASLTTEEIHHIRVFGDKAYVPYVDPQGSVDNPGNGGLAIVSADFTVAVCQVTPVPEHVFDVVATADGIFLFGRYLTDADNRDIASIWKSTDGGTTWTVDFRATDLFETTDNGSVQGFYCATLMPDGSISTFCGQYDQDDSQVEVSVRWFKRAPGVGSAWVGDGPVTTAPSFQTQGMSITEELIWAAPDGTPYRVQWPSDLGASGNYMNVLTIDRATTYQINSPAVNAADVINVEGFLFVLSQDDGWIYQFIPPVPGNGGTTGVIDHTLQVFRRDGWGSVGIGGGLLFTDGSVFYTGGNDGSIWRASADALNIFASIGGAPRRFNVLPPGHETFEGMTALVDDGSTAQQIQICLRNTDGTYTWTQLAAGS